MSSEDSDLGPAFAPLSAQRQKEIKEALARIEQQRAAQEKVIALFFPSLLQKTFETASITFDPDVTYKVLVKQIKELSETLNFVLEDRQFDIADDHPTNMRLVIRTPGNPMHEEFLCLYLTSDGLINIYLAKPGRGLASNPVLQSNNFKECQDFIMDEFRKRLPKIDVLHAWLEKEESREEAPNLRA